MEKAEDVRLIELLEVVAHEYQPQAICPEVEVSPQVDCFLALLGRVVDGLQSQVVGRTKLNVVQHTICQVLCHCYPNQCFDSDPL